jgi:signal peptidase II
MGYNVDYLIVIEEYHMTGQNPQTVENIEEQMGVEDSIKRSFRERLADYGLLIVIAGLIVILDQWTKTLVRQSLSLGETWMPVEWLEPYVRVVNWHNTGAAFGIFQQGGLIFTILAIVVTIFILYYFPQVPRKDWPLRVAMGMQLGGALGNLTDRLRFGAVTDFISVGKFPVFNVADSSISVGVAVLILGVWISERKAKKENAEEPPGD